ncbi:hypothetical protein RP20_CCG008746 [Aedes albopictus]|nr:hypothetical protein RP20_CCG008746 [Aedes albopictus]
MGKQQRERQRKKRFECYLPLANNVIRASLMVITLHPLVHSVNKTIPRLYVLLRYGELNLYRAPLMIPLGISVEIAPGMLLGFFQEFVMGILQDV